MHQSHTRNLGQRDMLTQKALDFIVEEAWLYLASHLEIWMSETYDKQVVASEERVVFHTVYAHLPILRSLYTRLPLPRAQWEAHEHQKGVTLE
jgi:hypothetical protein